MIPATGFQSATTGTVIPSATMRSNGVCLGGIHPEAPHPPASCKLSSRFDSIGAELPLSGRRKKVAIQVDGVAPVQAGTFKSTSRKASQTVIRSIDESAAVSRKAPQEALIQKTKENAARERVAKVAPEQALRSSHWKFFGESVNQELKVDNVVEKLESGKLWVVNSRRRNGLIVLREFHAEFAGPGAAVGGDLDSNDIVGVIPIGNLSLLSPDSHEAHQNAIKIRLQWIRLTQNFTDQPQPDDRARMILEQFKTYFDQATVDLVPDQAFAMLVGVLPRTIQRVRAGFVW